MRVRLFGLLQKQPKLKSARQISATNRKYWTYVANHKQKGEKEDNYIWIDYKETQNHILRKEIKQKEDKVDKLEILNIEDETKNTKLTTMIYYTTRLKNTFTSNEGMITFFQLIILETNNGFINSNVNLTL